MSSDITEILSGFSSAIDLGISQASGSGSVKLRGVREGRRQIPSQFLESVSSRVSFTENTSFLSTGTLFDDVIIPLDFEQEVEAQVDAAACEDETIKYLADFPQDDLEIVTEERDHRTLEPAMPEDDANASMLPHLNACLRSFTQNYNIVKRNYSCHGTSKSSNDGLAELDKQLVRLIYDGDDDDTSQEKSSAEDDSASETKSRSSWASSIVNLKNAQADPLVDDLLRFESPDEVVSTNATLRLQDRQFNLLGMFSLARNLNGIDQFTPAFDDPEFFIETLSVPPPLSEEFGSRLLVKCLNLELELDIEPVFVSLALYDAKSKVKLSENFYFELNSESTRKMIQSEGQTSQSTLSRTAIFSLSQPSHDVFIVIKLEKVLQQGDISECAEAYMKDATEKQQEKARQNAKLFCSRLGRYRMPFAWTAIHLMNIVNSAKNLQPMQEATSSAQSNDESSSKNLTLESQHKNMNSCRGSLTEAEVNVLSTFKPVTLTISSFFKQECDKLSDDDLYKYLNDMKRPTALLKKLKCIPGKMKVDVSPCPASFPYRLTPDLHKVKPYPDQRGRPTKEIQEFISHGSNSPNITYRNLLYVYPQAVNFTNRQGHFRNITVKVQLLDCEEAGNSLPFIYGKSNGPEFVSEAYAVVTYHNKSPDFYDEVKIQLPGKVTAHHHIFFTFYHISCQKKLDSSAVETAIGFTWLPLLQAGHLRVGDFSLPVTMEQPPPHYSMHTADSQLPGVKWVDGRRPIFRVNLHLVSTIHTLDPHLGKFFDVCDMVEEPIISGLRTLKLPDGSLVTDLEHELRLCISKVAREASVQVIVEFLYVLLNKLISMLVNPPSIDGQSVNMGQQCFEAIVRISSRLHHCNDLPVDSHHRNILLSTFTHHLFTIPPPSQLSSVESSPMFQVGSHYATMTRSEKRSRPAVSQATFHISSSNPDLTIPEDQLSPSTSGDDGSFVRLSATRSSLVEQSIKQQTEVNIIRSVSHKLFHEELVLLLVVSSGDVKEVALQNSWFIFEMVTKSMALHLHKNGLLAAPRADRFPSRFQDDLQRLVKLVVQEITQRFNRDYDMTERLNCSLAFFFNNLLSIMDRGFVFQMLHLYMQTVTEKIRTLLRASPSSLITLRLALLRIVCSHEHFVTLNLPFLTPPASSPTPSIISTSSSFVSGSLSGLSPQNDLSDRFVQHHYLIGLLLSDIRLLSELAENGQSSMDRPMLYALSTLRHLLASHDMDPRIGQHQEVRRVVASLYIPLLSVVLKALPFAHLFEQDKLGNTAVSNDGIISSSVASAIASPIASQLSSNGDPAFMSPECTRNLLICFLWLLKNTDREKLRSWWIGIAPSQLIGVMDLLFISISCFELGVKSNGGLLIRGDLSRSSLNKVPRMKDSKSRLQQAILGGSSARQEMLMRRRAEKSATIGGSREGRRWNKDKTEWKQAKYVERVRQLAEDSISSRNLFAEVSMIVLDTLDLIVETTTELADGGGNSSQILSCSLRILLHILSKRQSVVVLQHLFAIQRSIVAKFPELVFEEEIEQCADLSLHLLEKCTSGLTKIRMHAAASLYMLMRHNFSMGNNFARVKMQVTMSMSSLVGGTHEFDEEHLRRSLKTILSYAEADTELEGTSFPEQVRDLVFNLHMILSDTVKMKEHQEDPEMLIDLMYRIAKGYQNSPDLRLTWLQNMAKQHSERKHHAEAGMCLLHCAALVAEYLSMIEYKSYLPIGCATLEKISVNLLEESAVSDDVVSPSSEMLCTEKYFSTAGLTALLEQAIHTFSMAGLHEVVGMIDDVLKPIYLHHKDFNKLAQLCTKLSESYMKISSQCGKRMFGTYFRVAFYGTKFGDLNGEEFIYKEPAITKLPEISHRLETFYGQCFGEECVEMIKDSSSIDRESLDRNKAFIQITYVEPYFYRYEEEIMKKTYFERNFNVNKFVYATPFTLDGKAHGEMKEQYKRKTFLQVSHFFPYVKTRINVIKRWEEVLTPLQSACEDVKKKTNDLRRAVELEPADVRMLQVNLQGALLTSVNQGPMEVANTFLAEIPDQPEQYIPYNDLRLAFKKFIYACSLALIKNKSLISSDQKEYQREMERNYTKMSERLRQLDQGRRIVSLIRANHINNK